MKEPGQGPATLLAGRHRCGRGSWRLVVAHLFWLADRAWRLAGNTYHGCFICGHVAHVPPELLFIHLPWLLHLIHVPSSLIYVFLYINNSTGLFFVLSIRFKHSGGHGEIIYGDTSWIEDDCPDTFSEFFHFLSAAALCDDFLLVDSVET